jgi:hypothetical protein
MLPPPSKQVKMSIRIVALAFDLCMICNRNYLFKLSITTEKARVKRGIAGLSIWSVFGLEKR